MDKYKAARKILSNYFPKWYAPQPTSAWQGPFLLPKELFEYYTFFGPLNLSLPSYGNDIYLPQLADLWKYQQGYRWDALTEEKLTGWNDDWLVIADQGADPFIFSLATGKIRFDFHGQGFWRPKELFDDIENMATCLLILSSLVIDTGVALTNNEGHMKEIYSQIAQERLITQLGSSEKAQKTLLRLGWT